MKTVNVYSNSLLNASNFSTTFNQFQLTNFHLCTTYSVLPAQNFSDLYIRVRTRVHFCQTWTRTCKFFSASPFQVHLYLNNE